MQRNQSFGSPVDSRAKNVAQFFGQLREAIGKTRQQNVGVRDSAVPNQGYGQHGQMPYHNVMQGSGHSNLTDHANVSQSAYSGYGKATYSSQAASSSIRGGNQDRQQQLSYDGGEYRDVAQRRESAGGTRRHSSGSKEGDRYGSPRKSVPYRQAPWKWDEDAKDSRRAREERIRQEEAERRKRQEERIRNEREERARKEAAQREEQLRKEREEQRKKEERLRREREEKIRKEREERLRREREERLRIEREERQRKELEDRLKREIEEKLRREKEEQLKREREARIKREKEERLRRERQEMLRREREEHIRRERAREEQIRKEREREEQIRRQREREEQIRRQREREELIMREREEQLRIEREEQLLREREEMIRRETEEKLKREFLEREEQIRREAVERDRLGRAHASYRPEDRHQGNRYDHVDAGFRPDGDYYGGPVPVAVGPSIDAPHSMGRLLEAAGVQDEVALANMLASAIQNTGLPLGPGIQGMPLRHAHEEYRYEGNHKSGYGPRRRDDRRDSRHNPEHEENWRSRSRSAGRNHTSRERQVSGRSRTSHELDRQRTSLGRSQRAHSSHSTRTSDRTKRSGEGKADAKMSIDELEVANQLARQFGISDMSVAVQALKLVKQLGSTNAKDVTLLADLMRKFTEKKLSLAEVAKLLPKNLADMVRSQKIDPSLLQIMVNSYQAPPEERPRRVGRDRPQQRGEPKQRPQRGISRPSTRLRPGTSRPASRPQKSTWAGFSKPNVNRSVVAKRKAINVANRGVRGPQVRSRQIPNTRRVHIVPGKRLPKFNRK